MKEKENKVGGNALFNGILFSSNYRQVNATKFESKIVCRCINYISKKSIVMHIPILRGILALSSQIGNASPDFISSYDNDTKASKINIKLVYMLLILFCIAIPIILSIFIPSNYRKIGQALILILEISVYLFGIKSIKELDEIFKYHGAEHKAVNAYEKYGIEGLTLENIKKQKRFHKRCGGNFVFYFMILTILSAFIPVDNLILKYISMVIAALLNIGIAYDIVTIVSLLKYPLDIIAYPSMLIQYITTKEPDEDMLMLARYGVLAAARKKDGVSVREYINTYIKENIPDIDYDVQDIYKIIEYVLKIDINTLILKKDDILIKINQEIEIDNLLNRYYKEKYPLQYLTHKQFFYKEEYYVDENVLIPRSDTEILVEKALEYIEKENLETVIDLCTGSGCIGISIAKNSNENCKVELVDISIPAINIARKNAILNNVMDKVELNISNMLEYKIAEIEKLVDTENISDYKVDMIVSNPPYIKTDVIQNLDEEVKKEPILALDGGKEGLDFYINILDNATKVLKNNGLILLEIGYDQLEDIENIINTKEEYIMLESVKDYSGNDRVVVCRFQEK